MTTDPRLSIIASTTQALEETTQKQRELRAQRAKATWSLVSDPDKKETIASIARQIGEPEIRFRKSVEAYRDGIPKFKRS